MMAGSDRVLYLDFDGVLHPDEAFQDGKGRVYLRGPGKLFEHVPVLEEALAPYPDLHIVLSTSWVRMKCYSWVYRHLHPVLRERVIGATWHSRFKHDDDECLWWREASRYRQVKRDVLRRQPAQWLAIDDDLEGWPEAEMNRVVRCHPQHALGSVRTQEVLIERLRETFSA